MFHFISCKVEPTYILLLGKEQWGTKGTDFKEG